MAEVSAETVRSISTPDKVESRLGTLEFNDGAPSDATAALLYDHLDFIHGVQAFIGAYPGASVVAIRRGFRSIGAEDNTMVTFSELMDSASLFLTANCDTFYFLGFVDLSDGPMVIDVPALERAVGDPGDDRRHVVRVGHGLRPARTRPRRGRPVPARGAGPSTVRYPTAATTWPTVARTRALVLGRAFMVDNDPGVPAEQIRQRLPHLEVRARCGGHRDRHASSPAERPSAGQPRRARRTSSKRRGRRSTPSRRTTSVSGTRSTSWSNRNRRPAATPSCSGMLARLGIVHGQPFKPDERMRKVLEDAAVVGNATARTVTFAVPTRGGLRVLPGSNWYNPLWVGGYEFLDPPHQITADGVVREPSDGARKLNSKIAFLYPATGVTPAMCMRLTGVGSQYLIAVRGGDGEYLDGGRNYRLTLPPDIPQSRFWSAMLYDRQTRSMLQTDQPRPDIGSQSGTVETNPDGSTDIYFGPTAPEGKADNWLQTVPGKGWFILVRLYSPEASFFDKTWRPTEIEPI